MDVSYDDNQFLNTPESSRTTSSENDSDLIIGIELRRNDTGKTVGVFQERIVDQTPLTVDGIKTYWDHYGERLSQIFSNQPTDYLPYTKLSYFVYWSRYTTRDDYGFYFKCMSWHERRTIPDPFMNPKQQAYILNLVFYLVEDLTDPIYHEDYDPLNWVN